jgi:hypothetical protein
MPPLQLSEHVRKVIKRLEEIRLPMNAERKAKIQNELKQLFRAIQRAVPRSFHITEIQTKLPL